MQILLKGKFVHNIVRVSDYLLRLFGKLKRAYILFCSDECGK